MKLLFLIGSLLITFISFSASYASDAISFEDIDALESQGKAIILGELTGVGKAIPIDQVDSFVTTQGNVSIKKVLKVEFVADSTATVDNITKLVLKERIIPREELKGLILK